MKTSTKSTETTQNIIARLIKEVELEDRFLNSDSKSMRVKSQFSKVKKAFVELESQLDRLNDLKEDSL